MKKISAVKVLYRDALLCTVMTFIIAGILYYAFVNLSILDPFEKAFKDFKFTDMYYSERINKAQRNNKIVIVNIKHADRFQIAEVINKISESRPRVIGLDIIFEDRKMEFSDSLLKAAISSKDNIVTAYFHENDSIVNNHKYFQFNDEDKGYINLDLKGQNTVIRDFLGVKGKDNKEFAFSTQLALKAGYIDEAYALKEFKVPIPINYIGNKDVFLSFDFEKVLSSQQIPAFKDAVVILGYLGDENVAYDIEDKHFTPLNEEWVGRAVPDTFGVIIHANILNMLSKQNLLYRISKFTTYLLSFVVCFFTIFFSMKLYVKNGFVFDLSEKIIQLLLSVILVYLALLLLQANIYLSVVPMILLSVLGIEMIDYYEHLVKYLNKKFKWESRLS
ncbi:CHASE2 domain-containing protein [Winogradskyella ouciana]|uniref:CHASE2 domain-containing protein n=1 Tax=Winogradskyella ouciana TaxID=2608631 RepID=A0A7K1GGS1_9FLAO|nr:CHASE2 domain-containing protein [Winogradskyella ouciana]MTE28245.1 CHASE2 domain-containing protein [Winogradskyella ouciana]